MERERRRGGEGERERGRKMEMELGWAQRWKHLNRLLSRKGPLAGEGFEADTEKNHPRRDILLQERILVIGAGGLGCELLKDLTLVGFRNIDVIDMDTIDLSNLNRQFLFRPADVGKPKATAAAAFINRRVTGANVVPHYKKIQDFDEEFYKQFKIVVCGLDSLVARRWMNSMLINMVKKLPDGEWDVSSIIPLIDGGTEGLKGHVRVIIPRITSCFECMLDSFPPQTTFPMCTIANTPRLPEHCIAWALQIKWEEDNPFGASPDGDNPEHIAWILQKATERATEFGINGVNYKLTKGVVKNIIPAIASTNALVAAACANEALKVLTDISGVLDDYMMYNGGQGAYLFSFSYFAKDDCNVCGSEYSALSVSPEDTLQDFLEFLSTDGRFQFSKPSIRTSNKSLYMMKPEALRKKLEGNLSKKLPELIDSNTELYVVDPSLVAPARLLVTFKD
mmetsp:Transcript_33210/g.93091  ORF Transcript_33210/g.93091 Transcript_33210/m.93091 type:complete len:452 (-) Transcript_33210:1044-2399(-)